MHYFFNKAVLFDILHYLGHFYPVFPWAVCCSCSEEGTQMTAVGDSQVIITEVHQWHLPDWGFGLHDFSFIRGSWSSGKPLPYHFRWRWWNFLLALPVLDKEVTIFYLVTVTDFGNFFNYMGVQMLFYSLSESLHVNFTFLYL